MLRLDRRGASADRRRVVPDPIHAAAARVDLERRQHRDGVPAHPGRALEGRGHAGRRPAQRDEVAHLLLRAGRGQRPRVGGGEAVPRQTGRLGALHAAAALPGEGDLVGESTPATCLAKLIDASATERRLKGAE